MIFPIKFRAIQYALVVSVIVLLFTSGAEAVTIAAASCSYEDVRSAVGTAIDGDTVVIPGGVCIWSTQLTITKGIKLRGEGIDATILRDDVPKSSLSPRLLTFAVNEPRTFELSDLTIEGLAPDPNITNQGHVGLSGTAKAFRVHDVKFANQQTVAIRAFGYLWGVIDHCEFIGNRKQGVVVGHPAWGGQSFGDGSWAEELSLGTERAIYIEDNVFRELNTSTTVGAFDAMDGARVVFRHNRLIGKHVASHGTESSQRRRSIRSFEIYNNEFDRRDGYSAWFTAIYIRGGTGVIFANSVHGSYDRAWLLANYRTQSSFTPWGQCNGTSTYDQNTHEQGGYRCVDQPGAGTSKLLTASVPTPGWVENTLDPIYIWGNSPNTGGSQSAHVVRGRDYIVDAERPGYRPFVYPHPVVSGRPRPQAPRNVHVVHQ